MAARRVDRTFDSIFKSELDRRRRDGHAYYGPHVRLPHTFVDDGLHRLTGSGAVPTYLVLLRHANWKTGTCFVSQSRIAESAGIAISTVQTALTALEELGAIRKLPKRRGGCNAY